MQRIYVVRHGQSMANAHHIVAGSQESPLTELGKQQARLAGEHVRALGIDRIVCSPMGRAKETAIIIAEVIGYAPQDIVIAKELRERMLGELESTSYAKNPRRNGNYPDAETVTGIEPIAQLHGRVQSALRDVIKDTHHKNVLLVCHMNIGRMLGAIAAGQPPLGMYDVPRFQNGEVRALV